jgi:hypothetical protein
MLESHQGLFPSHQVHSAGTAGSFFVPARAAYVLEHRRAAHDRKRRRPKASVRRRQTSSAAEPTNQANMHMRDAAGADDRDPRMPVHHDVRSAIASPPPSRWLLDTDTPPSRSAAVLLSSDPALPPPPANLRTQVMQLPDRGK